VVVAVADVLRVVLLGPEEMEVEVASPPPPEPAPGV
jgi:hypothetical protein